MYKITIYKINENIARLDPSETRATLGEVEGKWSRLPNLALTSQSRITNSEVEDHAEG